MKFLTGIILVALVFVSSAANWKFGYYNTQVIFSKSKEVKDTQEKYDKWVQGISQEIASDQKRIKELYEAYEKQKLMMTDAKKQEKEVTLKELNAEYEKKVAKYFGQEGEIMKRNNELTKPIISKMNKILKEIADKENFDLILDISSGAVGFAKKGYDLSERIIVELNKQQ